MTVFLTGRLTNMSYTPNTILKNVAELRAWQPNNSLVTTQGYANAGDGGSGTYWPDPTNTFILAVPTGLVATPSASGGILAAGTYTYSVTAVDESGETLASTTQSATTSGSTSSITLTWNAVSGAAGYRLYGRTAGNQQRLVTVLASDGQTFIDDGGITVNGSPPSSSWQWDNGGTRLTASNGVRWHLVHHRSVKAEQFGAFGDGVTNNTAALSAAVIAMWALGGGVVEFQAGTYVTGALPLYTNVTLQGVAMDFTGHGFGASPGSSLQLASGANDNLIFIPLLQHGIRILDMQLDGNSSGNPSGQSCVGCQTNGTNDTNYLGEDSYISIERSTLKNARGNGFTIGPGQRAARIRNCYVVSNLGDGVHIYTSDCVVEATLLGANGASNVNVLGAGVTHITDCDIFGAGTVNMTVQDSTFFGGPLPCDRVIVTSCEFDFSSSHGVLVQGSSKNVVFANCTWNQNGQGSGGLASHLWIASTVASISVTNCAFTNDSGGAPSANYDIFVQGSVIVNTASNIHGGTGVSAINGTTNAPSQLHLIGSNSAWYVDNTGFASLSKMNVTQNAGTSSIIGNTTGTEGTGILFVQGGGNYSASFNTVNSGGANGALAALYLGKSSSSSRSLNAAGTVNASGADYAEYERKREDCGEIEKGQIVGFDAEGRLTDKFDLAIRFGVKSTDPSLVGGDCWHLEAGEEPEEVSEKGKWLKAVEELRLRVDRVAYCGKVPVNMRGGEPGQYVIPVRAGEGIQAKFVDRETVRFEEFKLAVGQVVRILPDGRAEIKVF